MRFLLANVGVPMISVQLPLMMAALVPVILVEAILVRKWVALRYRDAFGGVAAANFVSTIIGVPLAWAAMLAIQLAITLPLDRAVRHWHWQLNSPVAQVLGFLVSIAWLTPYERHLHWMIPAASALLLIPSFFVSVGLERFICRRIWTESDPAMVRRAVFRANVASYVLLFAIACTWLGIAYFKHSFTRPP